MLQPRSLAPQFTLPDQDGKPVSLADLRGRWVVFYFYPKDDTPGCTIEACEFTAALPNFRGLNAEVLGCSGDDAAAHTAFIQKHKLGIRLLTDADRSVMRTYEAFGKKFVDGKEVEGVIRSTVLIAPDGSVAHHWVTVKAQGHAEEVRGKITELQGAGAVTTATAPAVTQAAPKKAPAAPSVEPLAAKKPTAKKSPAKKPAPKKIVAKKANAKKTTTKKTAVKKPAAKKTSARKFAAKKPGAKKPGARAVAKPAAKTIKRTRS